MEFSGINYQSQSFIRLMNVKMPTKTIVGILTFLSRINFMLSCMGYYKSSITLGPGCSQMGGPRGLVVKVAVFQRS